ncbi:N-acetylmuramic acid 6-phosphate etherase [Bacillus aquiflavi]|uniref:N-acetylmuramic acid 6-phosphate etherase n=1 Tax=Bacillus aquiflavi TaxID=2672567 RepID=A0A6B3W5X3_9BACI|nr:N-acetylmuramic acid 6-phosphate etherase [Bacillus aquiflavi]MBA4538791.1 N-acetylmuramic acid 6-phosphate etherase [Bacillus aquiflavi]NEY83141.1 N-acetylmuramic acid 6-phosphate etherase [Bacillus aquiflavi]UAC49151.1 N-acetylmuramic acid 6-phosphate etherase [Bacillus aquiflavi]
MFEKLTTEKRNSRTKNLDMMTTKEILTVMNQEDKTVPLAIEEELAAIENAVETVIKSFENEGRLIYVGAGTSGRLGILDAVECTPTFGSPPEMIQAFIAGGSKAIIKAVEGAEDDNELGMLDVKALSLTENDTVIGIAASGRTPYVIGALQYANKQGANTISISCNKNSEIGKISNIKIEVETGPEVLTGSTRLKAGTAQKLILNMISTAAMIGIGKVYENLMVDVQATNMKLIERSKRIIIEATGVDYETAEIFYLKANNNVKAAIVMILLNCSYEEARERLNKANGFVRKAIY